MNILPAHSHNRQKLRLWRDLLLLIACRPDRLLAVCWWRLCGKRLRARYRYDDAIAALPFALQRWMSDCGREDLALIASHGVSGEMPAIVVHLHIAEGVSDQVVRRAIGSIGRQSCAPQRVLITQETELPMALPAKAAGFTVLPGRFAEPMDALCAALSAARDIDARFLVPLSAGGVLPRHAIAAYAAHMLRRETDPHTPTILYGDQREQPQLGRSASAWLKPEWDPRMIWSQDYLSAACALPVKAFMAMLGQGGPGAPRSVYEGVLQLVREPSTISVEHVPRIVAQTPIGQWRADGAEKLAAVQRATEPNITAAAGPFATVRLRYPLPATLPKVSIIVATRDRVELLRPCVEGVLYQTDYPEIELIIADNDSRERETLNFMEQVSCDPRVRVERWPHPFNYSAINNFAVGFATGEYLCLLNNDIEVIDPQWLTELVREAVKPGVGAVGARLLYPDRSIQHAGVAIGIGNAAGHAHRGLASGEPGYFAQALIARGASAVTAACLLVAKSHYDAVGGLDEQMLAVAYNDVDLCLKLRERGLFNLYTPAATLIHHESKSRGLDFAPEHLDRYLRELAVFQERWGTAQAIDRWHHPRLDRNSETFGKLGWAYGSMP